MNLLSLAPAVVVWLLVAGAVSSRAAEPSAPLDLWPKGVPGEKGDIGPELDTTKPTDGQVAGKRLMRVGNVSRPTLTIFHPAAALNTGAAVVVCPGGGYSILAWDLEGTEICEWLNSLGVTGVLLKYRVPARAGLPRYAAPLQDAQRALGVVRQHAGGWNLDVKKIGILGFSAGGHLAAMASTHFDARTYEAQDAADELSCRPDFTVLIYPAYLNVKGQPGQLAPEVTVTTNTPPAFLLQTQDDGLGVDNVMAYGMALQGLKIPAELHVFPTGGHGYGLRPTDQAVTGWPRLAAAWLRGRGLVAAK